jgi:hypothetical protein
MKITLDSIRAAADAKYGAYEIHLDNDNVTRLLNVLRLPADKRAVVTGLQSKMEADDADQVEIIEAVIHAVAETEGQAVRLITAVNGDLAVLASIMEGYVGDTQAGEA